MLAVVSRDPQYINDLESLLTQADDGKLRIITSVLSVAGLLSPPSNGRAKPWTLL